MLRRGRRHVPQHHQRIADELVDRATVRFHTAGRHVEIATERLSERGGRQRFGMRGEIRDVREHHAHLAKLGPQHRVATRIVELAHEVDRHVLHHRPQGRLGALDAGQGGANFGKGRCGWRWIETKAAHVFRRRYQGLHAAPHHPGPRDADDGQHEHGQPE